MKTTKLRQVTLACTAERGAHPGDRLGGAWWSSGLAQTKPKGVSGPNTCRWTHEGLVLRGLGSSQRPWGPDPLTFILALGM